MSTIVVVILSIASYFSFQSIFNTREYPTVPGCKVPSKVVGDGLANNINGLTFSINSVKDNRLRFNILDVKKQRINHLTLTHQRAMHIFLISNNFKYYYHLHPKFTNGSWSIVLPFMVESSYKLYIDFEYKGINYILKDEIGTLGFGVDGDWDQFPNYTLTTNSEFNTKAHTMVLLSALESGEPIVLNEFLGVVAHVVGINLQSGEYVHFHSMSTGSMAQCPGYLVPVKDDFLDADLKAGYIHLMSNFKESGKYRLFLQFMHKGRVVTKEFTVNVKDK